MLSRSSLLLTLCAALTGVWLAAPAAEAHTCRSTCNQIRRACLHSAKATRDIGRADCRDERVACQAGCEADPLVCPGDGCQACLDGCEDGAVLCRQDAEAVRRTTKEVCTETRASCGDLCVDPVDGDCVRACKAEARHDCLRPAKRAEVACKRACATGDARRACVKQCKRSFNAAVEICADGEALCVGECIGVIPVLDPPPPAPLP